MMHMLLEALGAKCMVVATLRSTVFIVVSVIQ